MPTYEYICEACGEKTEFFQSIKSNPKRKCPKCKRKKLKRLISGGAGVIFKGDGFYRSTDYINQKAKEDGLTTSEKRRNKEPL
jgi:putative FmdB family regulatory protein